MTRTPIAICAALLAALATPVQAQAPETGGVRLPPFEQHTLANGAVLVLMEKRDTPLVSLRAVLRGGSPVG